MTLLTCTPLMYAKRTSVPVELLRDFLNKQAIGGQYGMSELSVTAQRAGSLLPALYFGGSLLETRLGDWLHCLEVFIIFFKLSTTIHSNMPNTLLPQYLNILRN